MKTLTLLDGTLVNIDKITFINKYDINMECGRSITLDNESMAWTIKNSIWMGNTDIILSHIEDADEVVLADIKESFEADGEWFNKRVYMKTLKIRLEEVDIDEAEMMLYTEDFEHGVARGIKLCDVITSYNDYDIEVDGEVCYYADHMYCGKTNKGFEAWKKERDSNC